MTDYYTPPSDEIFNEIKAMAIKIWEGYDNEFGYVDEKVGRIKDLENIEDNAMTILAMFDDQNQEKLLYNISDEAEEFIIEKLNEEN